MIIIAADQYGIDVKNIVKNWLASQELQFREYGSSKKDETCCITSFIPQVTAEVLQSEENRGIMICGTGIGVDIGANRFRGIRSVLAPSPKIAEWSRIYDNSNVLCLSGRDFDTKNIESILKSWIETPFEDPEGTKMQMLAAMDTWGSK